MSTPRQLVVDRGGLQTIVVDWPGRVGCWSMGIPPSGPADELSFRLGNRLLDNPEGAAGLESQFVGPTLRFLAQAEICLAGAPTRSVINGTEVPMWEVVQVSAGDLLQIGACTDGARCYLLIAGGLLVERVLGSSSTFVKGQIGAFDGRPLDAGDVLTIGEPTREVVPGPTVPHGARPIFPRRHEVGVLAGPHDDRLGVEGCAEFLASEWTVQPASDRTGIRLSGPAIRFRPDLVTSDIHPSNVIDFAYCVGSISLSGDTPIIYPVDGPTLGGFMCPFTIVTSAIWKTGQMRPGDKVQFKQVDMDEAASLRAAQERAVASAACGEVVPALVRSTSSETTDFDAIVTATGLRTRGAFWAPIEPGRILHILAEQYDLNGAIDRLMTEKDDTFRLEANNGSFVVKVASPAEAPALVDLQLAAMEHVARVADGLPVQRVVRDVEGRLSVCLDTTEGPRTLRVLTYLDGSPLADSVPTKAVMQSVGEMLGQVSAALENFSHPQDRRLLLWNLSHLSHMKALLPYAATEKRRDLAAAVFTRFYERVTPLMPEFSSQVVHYDFSPFNLLIGGPKADRVVGVLDFGDVVRTARVFDLAVPVSNFLGCDPEDPWRHGTWVIDGYLRHASLEPAHLAAVADSAMARLALRALVTDWHAHQSAEHHRYMLGHARNDWTNLQRALEVPVAARAAT